MLTNMSDGKSRETKNYSETLGTRLTPQTMDRFQQYREANELGKTEAARRLIRSALDDDTAERRRPVRNIAGVFGLIYVTIWFFGDRQALLPMFGIFVAVMLAWSLYPDYQRHRDDSD
jgi:hypothetical protein